MPTTGKQFADFLEGLHWNPPLPEGISVINPYGNPEVKRVLRKFCNTYYGNSKKRILILGINPGRFGAGVTGIPFTDPVALEKWCGIPNSFDKKHELSSRFIYEMIQAFGGPQIFYDHFLLNAVCPLGFLKGIKNYNYYDHPDLVNASSDFIYNSIRNHATWNISRSIVFVLGKKNSQWLEKFNKELKLFDSIVSLEHPRFIMQYRLRFKKDYLDSFEQQLKSAAEKLRL